MPFKTVSIVEQCTKISTGDYPSSSTHPKSTNFQTLNRLHLRILSVYMYKDAN